MKNSLTLFLSLIILTSCDITDSGPDCSAVMCDFVVRSVRIQYVDKTTNKPLFGQGSGYTISDLKASRANITNYNPEVSIDPKDPTIVILKPLMGNEALTLGNLAADKITMETRASKSKECCAPLEIVSLKVNDEVVCKPCGDLNGTVVVIKK